MPSETIVAVYETAAAAEQAIAALREHGVPEHAIQHFGQDDASLTTTGVASAPSDAMPYTSSSAPYGTAAEETTGSTDATGARSGGFWGWLKGDHATNERHYDEYDRSISGGRNVVTVTVDEATAPAVVDVLDRHSPINLEEHAAGGVGATGTTAETELPPTGVAAGTMPATALGTGMAAGEVTGRSAGAGTGPEETLSLAEESLEVGKRTVAGGTTRVRRYVVEHPVEEQIRLRDETVSVFRRPVTGRTSTVAPDAFTDKVIEMTETAEEPVVAKTAFVAEEVVVQKGVEERVETVRDTVRKEEVEITGPDGRTAGTGQKSTTPL